MTDGTDDTLIRVDGVSKRFSRDFKRSLFYGVRDILDEWRGGRGGGLQLRPAEFWANRDVTFAVHRGECLGLTGPNGAGKSTLLRILSGLMKPDAGTVRMRGRVGAIIALGAGFNPLLTGRENIYVAGAIHGMGHREMARRFDAIVDFAEIAHALDAPVQTYSSGMYVRLGFSVAAALDPDILLLDEVLAVGDQAFRDKCYRRISELKRSCAIVFVSHHMEQMQSVCDRMLVMKEGRPVFLGDVDGGVVAYREATGVGVRAATAPQADLLPPLRRLELRVDSQDRTYGEPLTATVSIDTEMAIDEAQVVIRIGSPSGPVADARWPGSGERTRIEAGAHELSIDCGPLRLRNGVYPVEVTLVRRGEPAPLGRVRDALTLQVTGGSHTGASYQLRK